MNRPVVVLGGGGHAGVLINTLQSQGAEVEGLTDPNLSAEPGDLIHGVPFLGGDSVLRNYSNDQIYLANGVSSPQDTSKHQSLYNKYIDKGYEFINAVHPSAQSEIELNEEISLQVFASATLQNGVSIEENIIVNTGAIVDHGCKLKAHSHVAPGAVLSGGVTVGSGAHIGTGATVIQNIDIGSGAVVGAGAVVIDDVKPGRTIVGTPGEVLKT